jgi:tRNA dimethylallyltransferase
MDNSTPLATGKKLIIIVGPTAIGKTSLSIQLALKLNCEILSADSRQFYKEMSIGTAKPTKEEVETVPHHFVDFLSVKEEFTAGQFEQSALEKLEELYKVSDTAIVVGGSGLFVDAICFGLDPIPRDLKIRATLNERFESDGLGPLVEELLSLDPDLNDIVDLKNPMRVIRALEVCLATGKTFSSQRLRKPKQRPFEIIKIGLNTERQVLYKRINARCEIMFEEGWEEEVRSLIPFRNLNALNTVGYKELFDYFDGKMSRDECIALIKQHTRNFAKRQLTWFNKDKATHWIDPIATDAFMEAVEFLEC